MKKRSVLILGLLAVLLAFSLVLTGCPDTNGGGDDNGNGGNPAPTKVTLAAGSQGTAGDKKITELPTSKAYVVKKGNGKWAVVKADGTLDNELAALTVTAVGTPGTLSGTEITGLTNGETYDVYMYGALANGNDIPQHLASGGKNAMAKVSAIATDSHTFKLAATAGAAARNTTIIVLEREALPALTAIDIANSSEYPGTSNLVKWTASSVTNTNSPKAKISAQADDHFFTITNVGADTAATFTVDVP